MENAVKGVVALLALLGVAVAAPLLLVSEPAAEDPDVVQATEMDGVVVHGPGGVLRPAASFGAERPVFVQRLVGNAEAFEPTLGLDAAGRIFYMGMNGDAPSSGAQEADHYASGYMPEVWRSENGGLDWRDVSPGHLDLTGLPHAFTAATTTPANSGDPYLHVDADTDRVFAYHQQAHVVCDHFAVSASNGEEWHQYTTCPNALADDESFGDHPTLASSWPRTHQPETADKLVHFCSSSGCRRSLDGGLSWSGAVPPFADCDLQLGHLKAAPDGTLYLPRKACGGAQVAVSLDDGASWTTRLVDDTVWQQAGESWAGWDHEAAVAVDAAGNVYYLWMGEDRLPYLSVSRDRGDTWTEPFMVGAPGLTYALFPQIVAGDEGRIAFLYFGSKVPSGAREDPDARWHAYVGFSVDALEPAPVFATVMAHDPADPLRRGPCHNFRCSVGPGPMGNGALTDGVGDFLDLDIDPTTGRVVAALVDLCTGACAAPDGAPDDPAGRARAAVGFQVSGVRLIER